MGSDCAKIPQRAFEASAEGIMSRVELGPYGVAGTVIEAWRLSQPRQMKMPARSVNS